METTDLARIRAATAAKRPADVTRAVPLTLTAVRAVPAVRRPGRLARFNAWRREHYVADQLMRVAAVVSGIVLTLGVIVGAVTWAVRALIAGMGGIAAVGTGLLGVAAVVTLLALAGAALGRKDHGHSGYGFHWTKCK